MNVLKCGCAVVIAQMICSFPGVAQDATPTFKALYSFTGSIPDGGDPQGPLVLAPDGSLFGTTAYGGTAGKGSVYHLVPSASGWTEEVLHSFLGGADGNQFGSSTGVIRTSSGVLFGTTPMGGQFRAGIAYSLTPPATTGGPWTYKVIHTFGATPSDVGPAGLVAGTDGLYGTLAGGAFGAGAIYRLSPPAAAGQPWTESTIYNFTGGADGSSPNGITYSSGTIFGTAGGGGNGNAGLVFRLVPPDAGQASWTLEVLYSFSAIGGIDGSTPQGGVTLDSSGSVYGITFGGGLPNSCGGSISGCGIAYKLTPPVNPSTVWSETVIFTFGQFTGDALNPAYKPTLGAGGVLLGTSWAGPSSPSVLYKLTPPTSVGGAWSESILPDPLGQPSSSVTIGSSGQLYGTNYGPNLGPGGNVYVVRQ